MLCVRNSGQAMRCTFSILMFQKNKTKRKTNRQNKNIFVWSIETYSERIFLLFNHFFSGRCCCFLYSPHVIFNGNAVYFFCVFVFVYLWIFLVVPMVIKLTCNTINKQKQVRYCLLNNWIFSEFIFSWSWRSVCLKRTSFRFPFLEARNCEWKISKDRNSVTL